MHGRKNIKCRAKFGMLINYLQLQQKFKQEVHRTYQFFIADRSRLHVSTLIGSSSGLLFETRL